MIKVLFDNETRVGDLDFDSGLVEDDTFETAVLISLFTNRRATVEDDPPDSNYLEGWWGDTYPDIEGDQIGSKLWLLEGQKTNQEALELAKQYAEEALEWMIEDGIVSNIEVSVERLDYHQMNLTIQLSKPDELASQWESRWTLQLEAS